MIIGLYSPAARSGKSTVAQRLVSEGNFERLRFAGPLKAMTAALLQQMGFQLGPILDMVEGDAKEDKVPGFEFSARDLMKTLGTEWGRETVNPDLWVEVLRKRLQVMEQIDSVAGVVIDDLRFPNEYTMLRELGATLIKVVRPGLPAGDGRYEGLLEDHQWDYVIHNTGNVLDLYAMVDALGDVL